MVQLNVNSTSGRGSLGKVFGLRDLKDPKVQEQLEFKARKDAEASLERRKRRESK